MDYFDIANFYGAFVVAEEAQGDISEHTRRIRIIDEDMEAVIVYSAEPQTAWLPTLIGPPITESLASSVGVGC